MVCINALDNVNADYNSLLCWTLFILCFLSESLADEDSSLSLSLDHHEDWEKGEGIEF